MKILKTFLEKVFRYIKVIYFDFLKQMSEIPTENYETELEKL